LPQRGKVAEAAVHKHKEELSVVGEQLTKQEEEQQQQVLQVAVEGPQ
jgi:hypothetical protein